MIMQIRAMVYRLGNTLRRSTVCHGF